MARLIKVLMAGIRTGDLPVSSGLAYAYDTGTTTPGTYMYTAPDLLTATANPLVLDAEGRGEAYCSDTANFRIRVRNAADTATIIDIDPAESSNAALTSSITVDTTNDDALSAGAGSLLRAWMQFIWEGLSNQSTAATAADMRYLHTPTTNGTASTGAVGRYPYECFSDRFNVMDFGAAASGSSDDSAAIQAAINACATNGGGAVFFPGGIYRCDSQLTITNQDNVALIGDGPGSIIRQNFTTAALIAITGTSDSVEICSLQLQGGGSTGTTTALGVSCASGIPASLRPPVNIHDVIFSGSADGTGFNVGVEALGTRGSVNNCYFQRIYGTGSRAVRTNTGSLWKITNNHILGVDGAGTRAAAGIGNTVSGGGNGSVITGNYVDGCSVAGIVSYKNARNVISGNHCYSNQGPGVLITGSAYTAVTGNELSSNQYGVLVNNDDATVPYAFTISGNSCNASTVNGIRVIHAQDSASSTPRFGAIVGNIVHNSTQAGILLGGADDCLVAHNMVVNCTTNATYPGIEVQTALPVATHRGGNYNSIVGNHVTDQSGSAWVVPIRIQHFGGGGVTNVSTTHVTGNRLGATGSTSPFTYGVSTSSPLVRGGNIWTDGLGETKPYIAYTASTANVDAMYSGGIVTNRGAAATVTLTLPALTTGITDGMTFTFIRFAGFNFAIASSNTIVRRDGTSGTVTLTGTTDQRFTVVAMGAFWYADVDDYTT